MKIYEGKLVSDGIKVGVVCARFNDFLVSKLLSGCEDGLLRRGVRGEDIEVAWAHSAPLLPALEPARSMACSMVSVVRMPNITGTPLPRAAWATPLDTSAHT